MTSQMVQYVWPLRASICVLGGQRVKQWNKLPGDIVNIKDNDIFKPAVRDHLLNQGEWF